MVKNPLSNVGGAGRKKSVRILIKEKLL